MRTLAMLSIFLALPLIGQGVTWNNEPNLTAVVDSTLPNTCAVATNKFPVGHRVWVCDMSGTDGSCQVALVVAKRTSASNIAISNRVLKNSHRSTQPFWVRLEEYKSAGNLLWYGQAKDLPLCYIPPCGVCGVTGAVGPIGPRP